MVEFLHASKEKQNKIIMYVWLVQLYIYLIIHGKIKPNAPSLQCIWPIIFKTIMSQS